MAEPVSVRSRNPGAINSVGWVQEMPGYTHAVETTPGNRTAFFATVEDGIACWWELLRRYRDIYNVTMTIGGIIRKYGGGQDYSDYATFVENRVGPQSSPVSLDNDRQLTALARAMWRYEAGIERNDLTDRQLAVGFNQGRRWASSPRKRAAEVPGGALEAPGVPRPTGEGPGLLGALLGLVGALFKRK